MIATEAGESARWWSGPAKTVSVALLVFPPSVPVTVCEPAVDAVQVVPVHEPSGEIVNVVALVTSPRALPAASNACAV
jgi:hypothetical protein